MVANNFVLDDRDILIQKLNQGADRSNIRPSLDAGDSANMTNITMHHHPQSIPQTQNLDTKKLRNRF